MHQLSKNKISFLTIRKEEAGQRIDNYLIKILKGVPKNHIYKIIRSGEVKINHKKIPASYKIDEHDYIRIPPIRISLKPHLKSTIKSSFPIIYEDNSLLVINKPAGIAVHGGSGISFGIIEQLRQQRPEAKYLELIHRLDKETSGLLMIAKKRTALVKIQQQFKTHDLKKIYLALSILPWNPATQKVELALTKYIGKNQEKIVKIDPQGQYACSQFEILEQFHSYSLLKITLNTGRTHQIRVHMQSQHAPIAGDERYGNFSLNKEIYKQGLKRMFLHAYQLEINHPLTNDPLHLQAPLPDSLNNFLNQVRINSSNRLK